MNSIKVFPTRNTINKCGKSVVEKRFIIKQELLFINIIRKDIEKRSTKWVVDEVNCDQLYWYILFLTTSLDLDS